MYKEPGHTPRHLRAWPAPQVLPDTVCYWRRRSDQSRPGHAAAAMSQRSASDLQRTRDADALTCLVCAFIRGLLHHIDIIILLSCTFAETDKPEHRAMRLMEARQVSFIGICNYALHKLSILDCLPLRGPSPDEILFHWTPDLLTLKSDREKQIPRTCFVIITSLASARRASNQHQHLENHPLVLAPDYI